MSVSSKIPHSSKIRHIIVNRKDIVRNSTASVAEVLSILTISGCMATTPEWDRNRQESVTTRTYEDVTVTEAVDAAERVIRLAGSKKQVSFDYRNNGFVGQRKVFGYFIIGAMDTSYVFDVQAMPIKDGVKSTIRASQRDATATAAGFIPSGGGLNKAEGLYQLYYSRVDYLLGKTDHWISCDQARDEFGTRAFHFEPLCVFAEDKLP